MALAAGGLAGLVLALPGSAAAHGLVARSDLPIPQWLFVWAAAAVLVVSFVALSVLWPTPRLQTEGWRPLPGDAGRLIGSRPVEIVCGAAGVVLLCLVVYAGFRGTQSPTANITPTFIYVAFWLGLVPVSVLFGDVFRAFNPWRAIGRAAGWLAAKGRPGGLPAALTYPERLGHWPAAAGLFGFALMELVVAHGDSPRNLAIATTIYSAATFVAMALYGVERWMDRGETFSVYFNLFSRISVFETRDGVLGTRRFLSGLPALKAGAGTVALLAVMIGSVTFDGAGEGPLWTSVSPHLVEFFRNVGVPLRRSLEVTFLIGLTATVGLVFALYRAGIAGAKGVGGGFGSERLARAFVHTLVPISVAYVAAHYFTLLIFQGQAVVFLASDPLGDGSNLFGTAGREIDFTVIGATGTWYGQLAFVLTGHVLALTLAHDRAIALYDDAKLAVRSQYWMLAVMIGFTSLALWLLSQANA